MEYMEVEAYEVGVHTGAGIVASLIGAAPGGVWKCRFVARVQTPEGAYEAMTADFIKLNSGPIEQLSSRDREDAQRQLNIINQSAVDHGFEPLPRGNAWYSYRYQRPYDPDSYQEDTTPQTSVGDLIEEAEALRNKKRHAEAVERLTEAVSLDPNNRTALHLRADCLRMAGDLNSALRECDRAISRRLAGRQSSLWRLERAETYELLKDWTAALKDAEKVAPRHLGDHGKHMLWATMGHCYFQLGDKERSVSCYDKALKAADFYSTRLNRAKIYRMMGQSSKSIKDCEYILKKEPGNKDAQVLLKSLKRESN